ncbi:MAG: hypothetical protein Q8O76_10990, partial [Chloroflexota bacterium]|nr:hypothetical protein [Chloroflexota bacterium]
MAEAFVDLLEGARLKSKNLASATYPMPATVVSLFVDTLTNPEGPVGVIDPAASDKTKALVERLEKEVLALQNSDNYKAWLDTLAKFHH